MMIQVIRTTSSDHISAFCLAPRVSCNLTIFASTKPCSIGSTGHKDSTPVHWTLRSTSHGPSTHHTGSWLGADTCRTEFNAPIHQELINKRRTRSSLFRTYCAPGGNPWEFITWALWCAHSIHSLRAADDTLRLNLSATAVYMTPDRKMTPTSTEQPGSAVASTGSRWPAVSCCLLHSQLPQRLRMAISLSRMLRNCHITPPP